MARVPRTRELRRVAYLERLALLRVMTPAARAVVALRLAGRAR